MSTAALPRRRCTGPRPSRVSTLPLPRVGSRFLMRRRKSPRPKVMFDQHRLEHVWVDTAPGVVVAKPSQPCRLASCRWPGGHDDRTSLDCNPRTEVEKLLDQLPMHTDTTGEIARRVRVPHSDATWRRPHPYAALNRGRTTPRGRQRRALSGQRRPRSDFAAGASRATRSYSSSVMRPETSASSI